VRDLLRRGERNEVRKVRGGKRVRELKRKMMEIRRELCWRKCKILFRREGKVGWQRIQRVERIEKQLVFVQLTFLNHLFLFCFPFLNRTDFEEEVSVPVEFLCENCETISLRFRESLSEECLKVLKA
jgi:hypothetical protein